jgi:hypothetical protein
MFKSDGNFLSHVCATYLTSSSDIAPVQQPWANLGFSGNGQPIVSVFGSPSPVLNIAICQVIRYKTNLRSSVCSAHPWSQNITYSSRSPSFLMRRPSLLFLQPAWLELFCIWRRQVGNTCAAIQPSSHLHIMLDILATKGAFSEPNRPDSSSLSGVVTVNLRACFQGSPQRLIELCETCWLHSSYMATSSLNSERNNVGCMGWPLSNLVTSLRQRHMINVTGVTETKLWGFLYQLMQAWSSKYPAF